MPSRPYPYVFYRCTNCWRDIHAVLDKGPTRRLWCGRCACTQPFQRMDYRLKAATWPPPARQVVRLVPKEEER